MTSFSKEDWEEIIVNVQKMWPNDDDANARFEALLRPLISEESKDEDNEIDDPEIMAAMENKSDSSSSYYPVSPRYSPTSPMYPRSTPCYDPTSPVQEPTSPVPSPFEPIGIEKKNEEKDVPALPFKPMHEGSTNMEEEDVPIVPFGPIDRARPPTPLYHIHTCKRCAVDPSKWIVIFTSKAGDDSKSTPEAILACNIPEFDNVVPKKKPRFE
jgi:hypothetical protein